MVAALASYLDARHNKGHWSVRIDNIDPPREHIGSVESILHCLRRHGLEPDEPVIYQSDHHALFDAALATLISERHVFACSCTRRTLGPFGSCIAECHRKPLDREEITSLRVRVPPNTRLSFVDRIKGRCETHLGAQLANFIVKRRDGLYAYQLAAAIDDARPATTHVVRGSDLLESTFRQRFLQERLGLCPPYYAHLPVLTHTDGSKLSKQTGAPPVDPATPEKNLRATLASLGQSTPPSNLTVDELLIWATEHWQLSRVPT